ncbi:MAG: hypothetical protein H0A75_02020 [Candidatus Methanofishera endochildressiae]|uniref:SRP54-type proteins GTP-binding domain-containing protein n=1 Tax=Candidatus Methanofishera endochildressiae TaxID=2738884 RepID=A0A7Z0MNR9_9GAMM|nr:hypothetical protein [Candidatus Methanofishera endochildressiae]
MIKVVQAELESVMGERNEELDLNANPPAVILMAGLQGAGKTTTVAKLGRGARPQKNQLGGWPKIPSGCENVKTAFFAPFSELV